MGNLPTHYLPFPTTSFTPFYPFLPISKIVVLTVLLSRFCSFHVIKENRDNDRTTKNRCPVFVLSKWNQAKLM